MTREDFPTTSGEWRGEGKDGKLVCLGDKPVKPVESFFFEFDFYHPKWETNDFGDSRVECQSVRPSTPPTMTFGAIDGHLTVFSLTHSLLIMT